jgi:hypothetical protein
MLDPHALNTLDCFVDGHTPSLEAIECEKMLAPAFTHNSVERNNVCAAMAAEKDIRMFAQQGCFTIHSDRVPINKRVGNSKYLSCIDIHVECVRRIAEDVDLCGFRKGDMFPDLGHLADELRVKYPPHN